MHYLFSCFFVFICHRKKKYRNRFNSKRLILYLSDLWRMTIYKLKGTGNFFFLYVFLQLTFLCFLMYFSIFTSFINFIIMLYYVLFLLLLLRLMLLLMLFPEEREGEYCEVFQRKQTRLKKPEKWKGLRKTTQ